MITKLYDPRKGTMQVAGLMSGSGTNLQKIIEREHSSEFKGSCPYHVAVIFTDNAESNAVSIGKEFDLPVIVRDIKSFYKHKGKSLRDMSVREEFDIETIKALSPYHISVAAYAGYMSIATIPLINAFLGVNVHPADLSIKNADGTRKYTGDHAVRDAILAGEDHLRSTTHIIEDKVDYGRILMISDPISVILPANFDRNDHSMVCDAEKLNQTRLKKEGDWKIFPQTLLDIARGLYYVDEKGKIFDKYDYSLV